jgi:hypothetical protein
MDRKIERYRILVGVALLVVISALIYVDYLSKDTPDNDRVIHFAPVLESQLSDTDRNTFYHLPMGTGVFEYYSFMALVDPKTGELFYKNLERYGFLPDLKIPAGLPVGFTIEKPEGIPFTAVGFNCSACHVNEYRYDGRSFRVEGAPNLVDLLSFKRDLIHAAEYTMKHPSYMYRTVRNMIRHRDQANQLLERIPNYESMKSHGEYGMELAEDLEEIAASEAVRENTSPQETRQQMQADIAQAPLRNSRQQIQQEISQDPVQMTQSIRLREDGSIDLSSLGVPKDSPLVEISKEERARWTKATKEEWVRSIELLSGWVRTLKKNLGDPSAMTPPGPGRADAWGAVRDLLFDPHPQTAPSSIPPIWNTGNLARFQWNGTTNTNVQRAFSAAIGAGAFFNPKSGVSPIKLDNMMQLEKYAERFVVPKWPSKYLPAIDVKLRDRGEQLYTEHCTSCHDAVQRGPDGLLSYPSFGVSELGTDSTYVTNFSEPVGKLPFAYAMERVLTRMEMKYNKDKKIDESTQLKWEPEARRPGFWESTFAYYVRPLDGIWATAPYLHNNSVPSLYDLLLPASERPKSFFVGSREYDPKRVGFRYDAMSNLDGFELDTTLEGNSNAGHEYGTSLSDDDRWALVEFLKSK